MSPPRGPQVVDSGRCARALRGVVMPGGRKWAMKQFPFTWLLRRVDQYIQAEKSWSRAAAIDVLDQRQKRVIRGEREKVDDDALVGLLTHLSPYGGNDRFPRLSQLDCNVDIQLVGRRRCGFHFGPEP